MKSDFIDCALAIPHEDWKYGDLAYFGGKPILPPEGRKCIFPYITKEDILQMLISLQQPSDEVLEDFTNRYKEYVGANYAIATASGTASLHLALIGAGVAEGDEVILPAFTFIATAQAIVAAKAIPIFVDIDPQTYCIDPEQVELKITSKTKAILPVHIHGLPANMAELERICNRYGISLVEDASHAHSATYCGKICGSLGDTAGQSLMADKNFPVGGEGGIAFFKTETAYERAKTFLHETGIDYNMSWIAAAFGLSQLERLPYYDQIRQRNSLELIECLAQTRLFEGPYIPSNAKHSFNMFRIKIHTELPEFTGIPNYCVKEAIQRIATAEGVFAREWQNTPIPWHIPFRNKKGFGKGFPFILSTRDLDYTSEEFPNTLNMIETTLVICRELRAPVEYEKLLSYKAVFEKLDSHVLEIAKLAKKIKTDLPYRRSPRLG